MDEAFAGLHKCYYINATPNPRQRRNRAAVDRYTPEDFRISKGRSMSSIELMILGLSSRAVMMTLEDVLSKKGKTVQEPKMPMAKDVKVPLTIADALDDDNPYKEQWSAAIQKEYKNLLDRGTWILDELPKGRKPIGCRWVFTVPSDNDGRVKKFKARLVIQAFSTCRRRL